MPKDDNTPALAEILEQLAKTRGRMIWSLSAVLLSLLLCSIYLMTAGSEIAARPISDGSSINLGIIFGGAVVIIGASITAFYVIWANRILDPLVRSALTAQSKDDINGGKDSDK